MNDLRAEFHDGLGAVSHRLDPLFLSFVGMFGIVATSIGVILPFG